MESKLGDQTGLKDEEDFPDWWDLLQNNAIPFEDVIGESLIGGSITEIRAIDPDFFLWRDA